MIPTLLMVVWGGICSVWGGLVFAQLRARREGLLLSERPAGADDLDRLSTLCVVIPARNEAHALEHCLQSVLAQDHPALSVVVVDDRSEDATAAVAARIAQADPRVRVVRIDELPAGWMGKSHALWCGTRQVSADWLLFIDVDCMLDPHAVRTAVLEARRRQVALLTLWPRQAAGGFWEHLIIPLCAAIIALWFGSRRRTAFANGQFLLIERASYEQIGGHRAVRSALIEDIPLAELAAEAGVRAWAGGGRDVLAVRMYESYRGIRDGWARIYVGALRSGVKIALSVVWLVAGSLLPYVVAAVLLAILIGRPDGIDAATLVTVGGMCLMHLVLMMVASYRFWGMGGCKRVYLVLYPLSVILVIGILLRAGWWLMVRRSVPWRNRTYEIDRRGTILG